jgi:phage terminase large subunit-like protein
MISNAQAFVGKIETKEELDTILSELSVTELAYLAHDWEEWWARPEQIPPEGNWRTWGALTGRGWGKNRCFAEFVHREAMSGRARRIALCSQGEDECIRDLVHGESGLIAVSPPWEKAIWECGRVLWPNGAQAFIYTPNEPENCFGPEHDLVWTSEIHAWPRSKMQLAFTNLRMGCRLGYGRMIWDSNPRKRHPILKFLLERGERSPNKHIVIRGTTFDNADNLAPEVVSEWVEDYGGTQLGRAMLLGEQSNDDEGALFQQSWIDASRMKPPSSFDRRILSIDPAISERKGTDATGMIELGLDGDKVAILSDCGGKHSWETWGNIAVEMYFRNRLDCIVIERNRGGDACVGNIRAAAQSPERVKRNECAAVIVVKSDAETRHIPGVIYVKEVIGRDSKFERAEPCAPLYEKGRVYHATGADLEQLEETMTTWIPEPGAQSPNDLDALVWGIWELTGLGRKEKPDAKKSFSGMADAMKELKKTKTTSFGFGGGDGWGGGL